MCWFVALPNSGEETCREKEEEAGGFIRSSRSAQRQAVFFRMHVAPNLVELISSGTAVDTVLRLVWLANSKGENTKEARKWIRAEAPILDYDPIGNLQGTAISIRLGLNFRSDWDCIPIGSKPVVSWHMSWFWVLKWGEMSGYGRLWTSVMCAGQLLAMKFHSDSIQGK